MFRRTLQSLLVVSLMIATAWAAPDSFVGDWKLDSSRSRLIDQMKVRSLDGTKYEFDFGGVSETNVVDGTFQPGNFGTMLSVTVEGPTSWKVMRKKDGRMLLTATWSLSHDGKMFSRSGLTRNSTARIIRLRAAAFPIVSPGQRGGRMRTLWKSPSNSTVRLREPSWSSSPAILKC